jgi:hypothetical protein
VYVRSLETDAAVYLTVISTVPLLLIIEVFKLMLAYDFSYLRSLLHYLSVTEGLNAEAVALACLMLQIDKCREHQAGRQPTKQCSPYCLMEKTSSERSEKYSPKDGLSKTLGEISRLSAAVGAVFREEVVFRFKVSKSFDDRKSQAEALLIKHPGLMPIILKPSMSSRLPEVNKQVLCKANMTVGMLLQHVRVQLKLPDSEGLFMFINGRDMVSTEMLITQLYDSHKDDDGYQYIMYSEQEILG